MKKIAYIITNIKKCGPYEVLKSLIEDKKNKKIFVISLFGKDEKEEIEILKKMDIEVINLGLTKWTLFIKRKERNTASYEKDRT